VVVVNANLKSSITRERQFISSGCRVPFKADVYCKDPGLLLAVAGLIRSGLDDISMLSRMTYVLFKPDSFYEKKAMVALQFFIDHGYRIHRYETLTLSEQQVFSLWRYQWNRATTTRMKASVVIATCGPSVVACLRSTDDAKTTVPASVRLWASKGSAFIENRRDDSLRARLGVNGRYFGYVHIPDEPIDVVRELGIVLGVSKAKAWLSAIESHHDENAAPALVTELLRLEKLYESLAKPRRATRSHTDTTKARVDPDEQVLDRLVAVTTSMKNGGSAVLSKRQWNSLKEIVVRILDNIEGESPIVGSGEIPDPAVLWS